jgi:hypothetical protein
MALRRVKGHSTQEFHAAKYTLPHLQRRLTYIRCVIPVIFIIHNLAPPNSNDEGDKLKCVLPDCCKVDPTEEEESRLFVLELAFPDAPTPRREG